MAGKALRYTAFGLAGLMVIFAVVLASRFGADPGMVPSPLIGEPAPAFDLQTLDGESSTSLGDLAGDIVVINFFASWCLECREEHEDLVAASDSFGDSGVSFVQISYQEDPQTSADYLASAGTSQWTHYLADESSRTAIAYGVFGIPETYFVDESGIVVGKIIGEADALTIGATIDAIRRGESPGQSVTGDTQQRPDG